MAEKKSSELAVKKMAEIMFTEITKEDITKHFCPLATEKEVFIALGIINSLKLNPFIREVHLIKYDIKSPISIVVGYEVFIKRAERTGKLDGWEPGINEEKGIAWITIWRKDWSKPFRWEISLKEFSKGQATWKQIPSFMGKKVAIAQGFRLCFPDELGGMPYTREEQEVYDITPAMGDEESKSNGKPTTTPPQTKIETANKATETKTDVIPMIRGKVLNVELHKYKSGNVKTDYIILTDEEKTMVVSEWKEPNPEIIVETVVEAINVKASDYQGKPQYTAESIKIVESEIKFGK